MNLMVFQYSRNCFTVNSPNLAFNCLPRRRRASRKFILQVTLPYGRLLTRVVLSQMVDLVLGDDSWILFGNVIV